MPAILIEGGFMDSTIDIKKLRDKSVLKQAGKNIADAIARYFNLRKKTNKTTTKSSTTKSSSKSTYTGGSIVDYRKTIGQSSSIAHRKKLAQRYGIKNYKGTASQNTRLLNALRGKKTNKKATKPKKSLKVGQKVKIKSSAKKYSRANVTIPSRVKGKTYTIQQVGKDDVLLKEIVSWVKKTDVQ